MSISRSAPPRKISAKRLAALGGSLPSRTVRPSGKRPKPVNRARKASAFAHAYHSRERVRFVKSLPCCVCVSIAVVLAEVVGPSENAHTGKKPGKGLKSHYSTIVPLCAGHHRAYDEHRAPFDTLEARATIEAVAPRVDAAWRAHTGETE